MSDRILCAYCSQDWIHPYKVRATGIGFLICRECESVWLDGDDTSQRPKRFLDDLVPPDADKLQWDQIEPL